MSLRRLSGHWESYTLYLTLGVMSLLDTEQISKALALLQKLDLKAMMSEATSELQSNLGSIGAISEAAHHGPDARQKKSSHTSPLSITLTGLHSMHSPKSTSILYMAPSSPSHTSTSLPLYRFCLSLRNAFVEAGLVIADTRPLLLHATIVNTIYAPGVRKASVKGGGRGKSKAKLPFDATDILEEYEDVIWMKDIPVKKICINRMGAREGQDGEEMYEVEGEVDIAA